MYELLIRKMKVMKKKLLLILIITATVPVIYYSIIGFFTAPKRAIDVQEEEIQASQKRWEEERLKPPSMSISQKTDYYAQTYSDQVFMTTDYGKKWTQVPIQLEQLREGEYSHVSAGQLMKDSYYISQDFTYFLVGGRSSMSILESFDNGKTWQEHEIARSFAGVRFRKLEVLPDQTMIATFSGGRVMSSEGASSYISKDNGETWESLCSLPSTRILQSISWINEQTGFAGYSQGELYYTNDGGSNWQKSSLILPDVYSTEYKPSGYIFDLPEKVQETNGVLELTLAQENGDYKGGRVCALLQSFDNGASFQFEEEVNG